MPATSSSSAPVPPHYLPVRQAWLDRRKEPILDAELPIVDPHHHLWDRPGWRYLLDDLLDDTNSGHNIVATVYVQARSMCRATGPVELRPVGEVEFANGVAAVSASGTYGKTRACACIVGHADLTLGSRVEPILVALARAGGDRFRGIRHITTWDANSSVVNPEYVTRQHLMAEASFREGFAVLGRLGLSFDACLFHPHIDELTESRTHISGCTDRPQPRWRSDRNRCLRQSAQRGVCQLGGFDQTALRPRKRPCEARRARHAPWRIWLPRTA